MIEASPATIIDLPRDKLLFKVASLETKRRLFNDASPTTNNRELTDASPPTPMVCPKVKLPLTEASLPTKSRLFNEASPIKNNRELTDASPPTVAFLPNDKLLFMETSLATKRRLFKDASPDTASLEFKEASPETTMVLPSVKLPFIVASLETKSLLFNDTSPATNRLAFNEASLDKLKLPDTSSDATGVAVLIPTNPPSLSIITVLVPSLNVAISLAPIWVTLRAGPVPSFVTSNCSVTVTAVLVLIKSPKKLTDPSTNKALLIRTTPDPLGAKFKLPLFEVYIPVAESTVIGPVKGAPESRA